MIDFSGLQEDAIIYAWTLSHSVIHYRHCPTLTTILSLAFNVRELEELDRGVLQLCTIPSFHLGAVRIVRQDIWKRALPQSRPSLLSRSCSSWSSFFSYSTHIIWNTVFHCPHLPQAIDLDDRKTISVYKPQRSPLTSSLFSLILPLLASIASTPTSRPPSPRPDGSTHSRVHVESHFPGIFHHRLLRAHKHD